MTPSRASGPSVIPPADDPHPPYGRSRHPFFMHDMIVAQPSAIQQTARTSLLAARKVRRPPSDRPLLFVGIGTSFHAALGASVAARFLLGPRALLQAVPSFDLLLEPDLMEVAGCAVIFSASGETALTLRAQEALAKAGVPQILVSGTPGSSSARLADQTLVTQQADERAWTHTVSFTTALTASYALLATWAGRGRESVRTLHRAARAVLRDEPDWKALAERLLDRQRVLLLGSGPAEVVAREAALKLREGAGRFVAWCGVEEYLHGILPSTSSAAAVLAIAERGLEVTRSRQALRAATLAGAKVGLLGPLGARPRPEEYAIPSVPPAFSPAVHVIPFQLLTYWTAVAEGRNPDVMGYDDPRIWAARQSFGI